MASGIFPSQGSSKDRDKMQAEVLLNLSDQNGLTNIVKDPTRNDTIMDL